ncbi:hypothetical protein EMIHUDRAFT_458815, partial [Emiliania huxleyi CCMP1516]
SSRSSTRATSPVRSPTLARRCAQAAHSSSSRSRLLRSRARGPAPHRRHGDVVAPLGCSPRVLAPLVRASDGGVGTAGRHRAVAGGAGASRPLFDVNRRPRRGVRAEAPSLGDAAAVLAAAASGVLALPAAAADHARGVPVKLRRRAGTRDLAPRRGDRLHRVGGAPPLTAITPFGVVAHCGCSARAASTVYFP